MKVERILDDLRRAVPACSAAGFADLSTDMMLVTSSSYVVPQEHWDALASTAVELCAAPNKARIGEVLGAGENAPPDTVLLLNADELTVILQSQDDPAYALCCVCAPQVDVEAILQSAQAALSEAIEDD